MDQSTRTELLALLPRLSRFARSLTRSAHEADDLVQLACERAIRHIAKWKKGTRLDSWMFRILHNAWNDLKRAETPRRAYAEAVLSLDRTASDGEFDAITNLTLHAVAEALQLLVPEQKEVLLLVCVEEFSYAETAAILGVPLGTVMSRIARGRLALHGLVNPPPPGRPSPASRVRREIV